MFSDDPRPNTYVTQTQVDAICKQVADKYDLEGKPKIAYGSFALPSTATSITIDYSSACFTSPPIVVATIQSTSTNSDSYVGLHVYGTPTTTSAVISLSINNPLNKHLYWMAIGT